MADPLPWSCEVCKAPAGVACHSIVDGGPLPGRDTHYARQCPPEAPTLRKPRTRKPPVRRAPVSAAVPLVVAAKDLRRKK